jgi:hypothetical protein
MAQGAIVIRWGTPVRGREQAALEVFVEAAAYYDDLEKNHRITSHHPYISADRNGGMWLICGDTMQLAQLREEDDYTRLQLKAQLIAEDYSSELCAGGSVDDLAEPMGMFGEMIQQFS